MRTAPFPLSSCLLVLAGCLGDPALDRSSDGLEGGTPEYGRPEVLKMIAAGGSCTATLVHPRVAMTAKHCIDASTQGPQTSFYSGQSGQTFEAYGAELEYYGELRGHVYQPDDVLLVVLDRVLGITPAVPRRQPLTGWDVAGKVLLVGFGGTQPDHRGGGGKMSGIATISVVGDATFQTLRNATGEVVGRRGDSGGPVFYQGEVAGVMVAAPEAGILYDATMGGHRTEVERVDQYPQTMARAIARADALTASERGPQGGGAGSY